MTPDTDYLCMCFASIPEIGGIKGDSFLKGICLCFRMIRRVRGFPTDSRRFEVSQLPIALNFIGFL